MVKQILALNTESKSETIYNYFSLVKGRYSFKSLKDTIDSSTKKDLTQKLISFYFSVIILNIFNLGISIVTALMICRTLNIA